MRGQISSSEHQRRRVVEELEDSRAQLEEVTGAHMQAQEDVDAAGPAAAELHERRVALDNQISQLTREQRDVQRVADNAALELAKVKDSLSNAEVEDNMYASRLEQIDEQLEEVTASLESRRDRAEELEGALEEARQAQVDGLEIPSHYAQDNHQKPEPHRLLHYPQTADPSGLRCRRCRLQTYLQYRFSYEEALPGSPDHRIWRCIPEPLGHLRSASDQRK